MSATITRLDERRPSPFKRAAAAWRRFWANLNDLPLADMPAPLALVPEFRPRRVQKPLNWPLSKSDTFDEYLLDLARVRGLMLRTRDGHRVRLEREVDQNRIPHELRGWIETPDDCDLALQWRALHWMEDGSFAVLEHKWDLVSVETASCIHCDRHDIDMDYDMSWQFVSVDRKRGLGVCNRCAGGEAA